MANPIIQARGLTFRYTTAEGVAPTVLDHVDLDIEAGTFVAILGHNGSGKSTFAKHLNAILLPTSGKVYVDGMDTTDEDKLLDIRRTVGMVFQNPDNQIVASVVEEGYHTPVAVELAAYVLLTSAFCLLFGGTARDAFCGGVCGLAVGLVVPFLTRLGTNLFFKAMVGGFFCGLLAAGFTDLGVGEHIDLIITGAIMAQAPGLVITNFMRDVMAGDMMSGLVKLAEALLTGAGIALGTGVALSLVNAVWGVL